MKSIPPVDPGRRGGLVADGVVFHPRHPGGVLRLRFAEEVGLEAADAGVPGPPGERVDVEADEEVAARRRSSGARSRRRCSVSVVRVMRTPTPRGEARPAASSATCERDVLLGQPAAGRTCPDCPGPPPPCPASTVTICPGRRPFGSRAGRSRCEQPPALAQAAAPRRGRSGNAPPRNRSAGSPATNWYGRRASRRARTTGSGERLEPVVEPDKAAPRAETGKSWRDMTSTQVSPA